MTVVEQLDIVLSSGRGSLADKLAAGIIRFIADERLKPGDALPSTRTLAAELGVSRGSVVAAYDELVAAGYVSARTGSGTVVVQGAREAAQASLQPSLPLAPSEQSESQKSAAVRWDLRPGHPDSTLILERDWRAAWRAASLHAPGMEPLSELTHPRLQEALASHLRRTRGIVVQPEGILITPNTSASLRILIEAGRLSGRTVAVEDPGYEQARSVLSREGVHIRGVAVDEDGLPPEALWSSDAGVYLTPAHQYPLGGRMPVTRRVAILDWASRTQGLIIEDDYDGEFRYEQGSLPAFRSMPNSGCNVAYLGTASKALTPDLGLSWLIPPAPLLGAARTAQRALALGVSPFSTMALAHFIERGALSRHLARTGRTYRARRDALADALRAQAPRLKVLGIEAGLHLVVCLPECLDERSLVERAAESGLLVEGLRKKGTEPGFPGLVLGYSRLPESQSMAAVRALLLAIRECEA